MKETVGVHSGNVCGLYKSDMKLILKEISIKELDYSASIFNFYYKMKNLILFLFMKIHYSLMGILGAYFTFAKFGKIEDFTLVV